mgnify:CR=1 FL=1|jgi:F-type H+-transporting ATPase subunit c
MEFQMEAVQFFTRIVTVASLGLAFAAAGCGIAMSFGIKAAVEGIARNPESSGKVTVSMLIGLALIEALAIYVLVISLILIYATPMVGTVTELLQAM